VSLPAFTADGLLPIGDHELTFDELRQSMLVVGYPGCDPHWDASWRLVLVNNLEVLAKELWEVGIEEIFVDEHGHELEFPAAFRKRRGDFARKGIVRLKRF